MDEPKSRARSIDGSDRLVYREADDAFKSRLNTAIQIGWAYNTSLTILVVMAIFYFLDLSLVLGLILGILLAFLANFHFLMIQVSQSSRWEIYRNRVKIPRGFRRGQRVIFFRDIETIEPQSNLINERVIIHMKDGTHIHLDVGGQEVPLHNLMLVFDKYSKMRSRKSLEITIPLGP